MSDKGQGNIIIILRMYSFVSFVVCKYFMIIQFD